MRRERFERIDLDRATRAELIAHIDELEFILEQLLPSDLDVIRFAVALKIAPQPAVLLSMLSNGLVCTRAMLAAAVHAWRGEASVEHAKTMLTILRNRLRPYGVRIENIHSIGWRIPKECLPALQSIQIDERPPILSRRAKTC